MAEETLPAPQEQPADSGAMSDSELAALLAAHEQRSVGYYNSEIADEQAKAINYYYGIMDDLPAVDGGSSVTDAMVAIMVDNGLAAILKPFVSADQVVAFDPRGPEDVEQAEQATEYVNYVIQCDNPGFQIFHDWFKDALLTKIGVTKTWWEDTSRNVTKPVLADPMGVLEARKHHGYLNEQENPDGSYTVNIQELEEDGRIKVVNIPPEEFLISPFARSIEEAPYVAHRPSNVTRSDLIEMGVDHKIVDDLPAFAMGNNEESRGQARYRDEEWFSATREVIGNDRSRDVIGVLDEYVKVDYDGDGVAELRRIIRVSDTILFNEEVDDNPFATLCPVPMPHKVYGRSVADQAMQGQKVRTAVTRQTLENLYKTNNPRPEIPETAIGKATLEDLQDGSPGAAIRTKVPGQLNWMAVPFTAQHSFTMLEAIARDTEEQTGIQRNGQGFNAEALKKNSPDTATQAAIDENARNERAEMIARIFAETGVKRLFKLILKLLVAHQPRARIIRLRNTFVEMDPSGWNPEMDLSISVGLGVGNKSEQITQAQSVLQTMAELQQTPYAYLVQAEHVHAAVQRLYTATGIKDVDNYIADPTQVQPPPPAPDPKMAEAEMKMQMEQMKLQAQQQQAQVQMQLDQQKAQMAIQLEQAKSAAKIQIEQAQAQAKAQIEAARLQLEQAKANFEAQLAMKESEQQFAIERAKLAMQRENNAEAAAIKREGNAMKSEKPGGKLNK